MRIISFGDTSTIPEKLLCLQNPKQQPLLLRSRNEGIIKLLQPGGLRVPQTLWQQNYFPHLQANFFIFLNNDFLQSRLVSNSVNSTGWSRTPDPPDSTYGDLGYPSLHKHSWFMLCWISTQSVMHVSKYSTN